MNELGNQLANEPKRVARVPIHPVDMQGALARVDEFIRARAPHYNIAINAAKIVEFQDDEALRNAIGEAHLLTADGQAVVWAARLLGQSVPARVAGTDLMQALLAHGARRRYSVYLLGAKDEVVRACVEKAQKEHPELRIAGYRNGYFRRDEEADVVAAIRAAQPDILFLGFGTPAKEYFMHRHYRALGVPFVMGVGGSFDVYAGLVARAPQWMQRAGLEWAFRLAQEPRRMWKRYLVGNTRFVWIIARELLRQGARLLGREQDHEASRSELSHRRLGARRRPEPVTHGQVACSSERSRAQSVPAPRRARSISLARACVGKAMARPDQVRQVLDTLKKEGLVNTFNKVRNKLDSLSPLGYSAAGRVVAVGDGCEGFAVGDAVACAGAGYANHAELLWVPSNLCAKIPDGVAFEDAAFSTIGAIALQGVRQAEAQFGETIVVIGLGLIGQLTVQLLRASGCRVIGVDVDPWKVELAQQHGIELALVRSERRRRSDAIA